MSQETQLTKLGLHLPTDPRWVNLAEKNLEEILTDHAYCEQKAATACISLIQGFPDKVDMVEALAPIVTEEWGHFRMVLRELKKRELRLGKQRKDEYVNAILKLQKKGGDRDQNLVERLLICALIEARSCERFRLLSLELEEQEMRDFYRQFMISEAGHYKMFIQLAKQYGDEAKVEIRWKEILAAEAEILANMTPRGDRMH